MVVNLSLSLNRLGVVTPKCRRRLAEKGHQTNIQTQLNIAQLSPSVNKKSNRKMKSIPKKHNKIVFEKYICQDKECVLTIPIETGGTI